LLEKNAIAAIEYLADNIRWEGILDFVVRWDKDNLFRESWNPPAGSGLSAGPGFLAYGDPRFGGLAGLTEAITGEDVNGNEFEAGMWVDPKNSSITSYGIELYIDKDPNPLDDDIDRTDFLSIFLHEIFHSLGFWSTKQFKNTEYYYGFKLPPTKFDSLTIEIDDQWYFNGKKTREIHGGPLPLALTERAHYSDSLEFNFDLMREYGYAEKWQISDIDLAILYDLGHNVIKWGLERLTEQESETLPKTEIEPEFQKELQDYESPITTNKVIGTKKDDAVIGTRKSDFIDGKRGNDALAGEKGNDLLRGGRGQDVLTGSMGKDFLDGSAGADTLNGGKGADVFQISKGIDLVEDFNIKQGDRIALDQKKKYSIVDNPKGVVIKASENKQLFLDGLNYDEVIAAGVDLFVRPV